MKIERKMYNKDIEFITMFIDKNNPKEVHSLLYPNLHPKIAEIYTNIKFSGMNKRLITSYKYVLTMISLIENNPYLRKRLKKTLQITDNYSFTTE